MNNKKVRNSTYQASKKYGSHVQLYTHSDGDITYLACFKNIKKLDKNGRPMLDRVKIGRKSEGITEQYAKAKYDEYVTVQRLGEIPEPIKRRRKKEIVTLNDLATLYFNHRDTVTVSGATKDRNINKDQLLFNKHLSQIASQDIEQLNHGIIEKLKQEKLTTLAPKTVNNILTLLSSILNYARKENKISNVPQISKIRGADNVRERYLNDEEVNLLLEELKDNQQLTLFVKLSLLTGGRLETIRAIKVKDVNIKAMTINLTDYKVKSAGKNNSSYTGYLKEEFIPSLLKAISNKAPNDYVLQNENGTRVGSDYIQSRLKVIFDKLFNQNLDTKDSVNRVVVHTLRHTFASLLAISGTPIYTIQKLMNHADIKMTMRYAKLSPDNGMNAINGILNNLF